MPTHLKLVAFATVWVTSTAALSAGEPAVPGAAHAHPATRTASALGVPPAPASLFAARRAADDTLSGQRGGTEAPSEPSLQGTVSNNQVVKSTTGSNQIAGGALAGASGVPVVIQNTGNNVLIQSSTIVNVQVK